MVYGETDVNLSHEAVRQRTLAIEGALKREYGGHNPNVATDFDGTGLKYLNCGENEEPTDLAAKTRLWNKLMHGEGYTDAEILVPPEHTAGGYSGKPFCVSGDHILGSVDKHTSMTKRRTSVNYAK